MAVPFQSRHIIEFSRNTSCILDIRVTAVEPVVDHDAHLRQDTGTAAGLVGVWG